MEEEEREDADKRRGQDRRRRGAFISSHPAVSDERETRPSAAEVSLSKATGTKREFPRKHQCVIYRHLAHLLVKVSATV